MTHSEQMHKAIDRLAPLEDRGYALLPRGKTVLVYQPKDEGRCRYVTTDGIIHATDPCSYVEACFK